MVKIKNTRTEIFFLLISIIVIVWVIFRPPTIEYIPDTTEEIPIEPKLKYGLPVDSFLIVEGVIKRNQNLSDILVKYGVDWQRIDKLVKQSKDTFDVRKIISGKKYFVFQTPDSLKKASYFIYEKSAVDYVVFELNDSLKTYTGKKPISVEVKSGFGVINSSLWNAIADNGLNPVLAIRLNDIYAWSINFFGLQKGDRFRVIYEEQFVDSISVGLGEIYAVQFDHMRTENYAIRFFQDNRFDYFNEKGQNMRKAFLKAPLNYSRISSRFSNSRMHPVLKYRRAHHGVDYAAAKGTPVLSIGDGTVVAKAYQKGGGGYYLKIKHNTMYTTTYMHLSKYGKGMATGVRVKQGQVIGYVGSTGIATGPHLDFRISKNGQMVDPLSVKAPPVDSLKSENIPEYTILKDSMILELQKINWE